MKKILAILLALVMVLSMVACGAKQEAVAPAAPEAPKEEAAAPAAPEAPKEEAPAEEGPSQYALEAQAAANAYANDTFFDNSENYKDFNADGKLKVAFVCK